MSTQTVKLILASNSPRRIQLMRELGYRFEVRSPIFSEPEPRSAGQVPHHWAEALSYFKARSVASQLSDGCILAADTIVVLDHQIFGKPVDLDDARRILSALRGTTHLVISGVTLLNAATRARLIRHETTRVTMRDMSDETLEAYLKSGLWRGKAGAYGIQDRSDANIQHLEGSYSNVMGLPVELVEKMLSDRELTTLIPKGRLCGRHFFR